jgi:hypothetical protein
LNEALGDPAGEAESLFWIGCFHQIVRCGNEVAVPVLERSCELVRQAGDKQTMSGALRHQGIAAHAAGPKHSTCRGSESSAVAMSGMEITDYQHRLLQLRVNYEGDQGLDAVSSATSRSTCRAISSLMGRTAATSRPAGSGRSQSR